MLVENLHSDGVEEGVSNPSSVMTILNLPELVGTDFTHGDLVSLEVILNGDLS